MKFLLHLCEIRKDDWKKELFFSLWVMEHEVLLWLQFCHFPVAPEAGAKRQMEIALMPQRAGIQLVGNGRRLRRREGQELGSEWLVCRYIFLQIPIISPHSPLSWSVSFLKCLSVACSCACHSSVFYCLARSKTKRGHKEPDVRTAETQKACEHLFLCLNLEECGRKCTNLKKSFDHSCTFVQAVQG